MRRIRSKLTYANVMATLAVFLVLGGGTAVALQRPNTVQSDDLGPGAQVKAADVADNAVNGANIVNNSVTGGDVKESTLNGLVRGRMLDFNLAATGPGDPHKPIATVGPYKLSGECISSRAASSSTSTQTAPRALRKPSSARWTTTRPTRVTSPRARCLRPTWTRKS